MTRKNTSVKNSLLVLILALSLIAQGPVAAQQTQTGDVQTDPVCRERPSPPDAGSAWNPAGQLNVERGRHTATLLDDGRVLVAGGISEPYSGFNGLPVPTQETEIWNPRTSQWCTTGSMATARYEHQAVKLPGGKVLVVGGRGAGSYWTPLSSAEIFDPQANNGAGAWSPAPSMVFARLEHTATALAGGKVLVVGGEGTDVFGRPCGGCGTGLDARVTAEIFDPAANEGQGSWSLPIVLGSPRYRHSATALWDSSCGQATAPAYCGKVLISGGGAMVPLAGQPLTPEEGLTSSELYDPTVNAFIATGSMQIARFDHLTVGLQTAEVLAIAGEPVSEASFSETYDPVLGIWKLTGGTVQPRNGSRGCCDPGRNKPVAALLADGNALIAGGSHYTSTLKSAELYNRQAILEPTGLPLGAYQATADMAQGRYSATATVLKDGRVLVVGGESGVEVGTNSPLASSELYGAAIPNVPQGPDFNADGKTDPAVYRASTGVWYPKDLPSTQWGGHSSDIPVAADYDGDNDSDIAVYRGETGTWYIKGGPSAQWGGPGDIPVPADYNGDGLADIAVYRPSNGVWYVKDQPSPQWGGDPTDTPVPADYNGDAKDDIAVYRAQTGTWYIKDQFSSQWGGAPGDKPVPADYDGDAKADIAVYRAQTGTWHIKDQFSAQWGDQNDTPVPADYNQDGKADTAIYRPQGGFWHIRDQQSFQWGGDPSDVPVK